MNKQFWRGVQTSAGSIIGVGIFGLPFVFSQAGFVIGVAHLVLGALLYLVVLIMYAEVVMHTPGHKRLVGLVGKYIGPHARIPTMLVSYAHVWGAMVAYIIIGGEFLYALFGQGVGGLLGTYQVIFGISMSLVLIGGLGFISRIESIFVWALLGLLLLVALGSLPHADLSNLATIEPRNWFLPFGVTLFAFGGVAALPETADVLGRQRYLLRRTVAYSILIVSIVYIIFSGVVVAVTGLETTQESILGLGSVIGDWAITVGAIIGLFSVFTSFIVLGVSVMDSLIYDYKMRYMPAWFIAVAFPFVAYLFGAKNFINVIGFTGAVLGTIVALTVIYLYKKAKRDVCIPKNCLLIPQWVTYVVTAIFIAGMILTLIS